MTEKKLFLIGYRGSGKTSVGRRLSELLSMPAIDSDDWIEREAGKSIREIFSESGESIFRDLESQAISQIVAQTQATIVSLGGGAVIREENRKLLAANGWTIWLQTSVAEILVRIHRDPTTSDRRPALTRLSNEEEIVQLLEVREPIYRETADQIVQTENRDIDAIASEIATWVSRIRSSRKAEHPS